MAKVSKVTLYIIDHEEYDEDGIKSSLERFSDREDFMIHIDNIKQSEPFEWEQDIDINNIKATSKDFEKYVLDEKDKY